MGASWHPEWKLPGGPEFLASGSTDGMAANPDNPALPLVFLTITRPDATAEDGRRLTLKLRPSRFEYISSITAMDYMEMTFPDPGYELIDHPLLEEDLRTTFEVRFGFLDGANMSDPVQMVFYRQKPNFPTTGMVETTLAALDQMVFFTLPLESMLVESTEGVSVEDLVNVIVAEVNRAYGRQVRVEYDGHQFAKKWWRFHTATTPKQETGGQENADTSLTETMDGRPTERKNRTGTPLEFLYGILRLAESENTGMPIELFVEGDAMFFRPGRRDRKPVAAYRYFSAPTPVLNQLLAFEPEVNLKPTMKKVGDVDATTGEADEATAGNDADKNAPNLTPASASVYVTDTRKGGTELQRGGTGGDLKEPAPEPTRELKQVVVKTGDTIELIAKRVGVSAQQLLMENNLPLDPSQVSLTVGQTLKYTRVTNLTTDTLPNGTKVTAEKVTTPEQQARANRAYLTEEYKAAKARATVFGHPKLKAGWPIYIDNVGKRWEGPWYIEEVKHVIDENGYLCELLLSRDGFMIAREAQGNTGYDAGQDYTTVSPAEEQERKEQYSTNTQKGGTTLVTVPAQP